MPTTRPRYSRRHYEQFAGIIRDMRCARPLFTDDYLEVFTNKLVATFRADNPRFDAARFLAACAGHTNRAR